MPGEYSLGSNIRIRTPKVNKGNLAQLKTYPSIYQAVLNEKLHQIHANFR